MIAYLDKDITTAETGVIAQGVNCMGVMGSGVAKVLRDKWPVVFDRYEEFITEYLKIPGKQRGDLLGYCNLVCVDKANKIYIANCFTQHFYGYNGRFASVKAIENSISAAYGWADFFHIPLYLPKIGAGRGGLDWETEVEPIIRRLATSWSRVDTYVCTWVEK